jgi:hypothetical protein
MGQRQEHRRVGLGSGVGLNVGVVAVEQLLDPLDGQTFGHVYIRASAVVALARVAFSILVCKHRILDSHHQRAGVVLGGNQFDVLFLSVFFVLDCFE